MYEPSILTSEFLHGEIEKTKKIGSTTHRLNEVYQRARQKVFRHLTPRAIHGVMDSLLDHQRYAEAFYERATGLQTTADEAATFVKFHEKVVGIVQPHLPMKEKKKVIQSNTAVQELMNRMKGQDENMQKVLMYAIAHAAMYALQTSLESMLKPKDREKMKAELRYAQGILTAYSQRN